MTKKKCKRTIKLSNESKQQLARQFGCTERMVYKALCFECDTLLARKIRYVARKDMGGWVEAAVPESEIFYDTTDGGERLMRQYFGNGAVLEVSLETGAGVVKLKGEAVKRYDYVYLDQIPCIQQYAMKLV